MYEGFLDERFAEQVMARGTSNVIAGKVVGPAAEAVQAGAAERFRPGPSDIDDDADRAARRF
jgi:hypothetical protein